MPQIDITKKTHYTFFEEIGRGGMGVVYRAVNNNTQQEVAIKVLHPELIHDQDQVTRFEMEAQTQGKIEHPNVVRFVDIYEHGERLGIIMELLKGCTLKQYIKHHGALDTAEVHAVIAELIQGLDAAHAQCITHRDLKLSNIFICDDGGIKIMDFGLAKSSLIQDDIAYSGNNPIGSYYYMAPEQILGRDLDDRTDLYALGIVMFQLATAQLPFTAQGGGGEFEIMEKQVRQSPPNPQDIHAKIPEILSKIVLKLLQKNPDKRFQTCRELHESCIQLGSKKRPSLQGKSTINLFSDLQFYGEQTGSNIPSPHFHELVESENDDQVIEHTLLWVFESISPTMPDIPPVDLTSPPPFAVSTLKHLRQGIATIPPLPELWHDTQVLINDPHAAAADLAQLLKKDPILTQRILDVCNSPAYAMLNSPEVKQVALALTRLGMDVAQDIILQNLMPEIGSESTQKDVQHLHFHAQTIALFTRVLTDYSQIIDRQSARLFGMLHDIGKLVILHIEGKDKLEQLRTNIEDGIPTLKAEWDILGYTHIDAGMMLALHWKLPRSIHHFIYYHHHPCWHSVDSWPANVQPAIMVVHLAHIMSANMLADVPMDNIWQQGMRSHVPESKKLMQRRLHLPVHDVTFYRQMEQELKRLQLQFPALFPVEVSEPVRND
ncbi:MAG: protein kinase [Mariprofundaceae bacterium]|nr:protein kinase [Mariprofundaceae bacterium]